MADVQDAFAKFDSAMDQWLAAATAYVVRRNSSPSQHGGKMKNFVRVEVAAPASAVATQVLVTTATPPYQSPPLGGGVLTLADDMSNPTRLEVIYYQIAADNGDGTLTLTGVERGAESTASHDWSVGDAAFQAPTAGAMQAIAKNVLLHLPDMSGFAHDIAASYIAGNAVTINLSGATNASGQPVLYTAEATGGAIVSTVTPGLDNTGSFELTLPASAGSGSLIITATAQGVQADPVTVSFAYNEASVVTPTILTPAHGLTGVVLAPVITTSEYATNPDHYDTHEKSRFRISLVDGTIVWDSGEVSDLTATTVVDDLPAETLLDVTVQHKGALLGWGDWSEPSRFTTGSAMSPGSKIYKDGVLTDIVIGQHNGEWILLRVSADWGQNIKHGLRGTDTQLPNITSAATPDPWGGQRNTDTLIDLYDSVNDGYGSVGPPAARFCRALGPEYFLMDKDQLKFVVDNQSIFTAADDSGGALSFASIGSGWIWSSSEYSSSSSWVVRPSGGSVDYHHRTYGRFVVPARSISV